MDSSIEFSIEDIASLQDACIDNELLENHLLNHESKEEIFKKQFLIKYARTYGYSIVSKEDLFIRKYQYLQHQESLFLEKKNTFNNSIKLLKQEISNLNDESLSVGS